MLSHSGITLRKHRLRCRLHLFSPAEPFFFHTINSAHPLWRKTTPPVAVSVASINCGPQDCSTRNRGRTMMHCKVSHPTIFVRQKANYAFMLVLLLCSSHLFILYASYMYQDQEKDQDGEQYSMDQNDAQRLKRTASIREEVVR